MTEGKEQIAIGIWNRLTSAQRSALKRLRQGRFLYRTRNGWKEQGSSKLVSRETVRILMTKGLVHEQTFRQYNPLFLTPLGKDCVEASEARAASRKKKRQAKKAEEIRQVNRRHYQDAMDGCGDCFNGYVINCKSPSDCEDPTRGCPSCMTKCTACYEREGVLA